MSALTYDRISCQANVIRAVSCAAAAALIAVSTDATDGHGAAGVATMYAGVFSGPPLQNGWRALA